MEWQEQIVEVRRLARSLEAHAGGDRVAGEAIQRLTDLVEKLAAEILPTVVEIE